MACVRSPLGAFFQNASISAAVAATPGPGRAEAKGIRVEAKRRGERSILKVVMVFWG